MSAPTHLQLRPLTRAEARRFIARHHRHSKPPAVSIFQIGAERNGELVGVVIGARPISRMLDDGKTLEITRVATDGSRNACSKLYGAACRAASALGYERVVTYTLERESGASLRAAGFRRDTETRKHDPMGWLRQKGRRGEIVTLFGEVTVPQEPKVRWWRSVA